MNKDIQKALNCGAIDVDDWDEDNNPMVICKAIMIALLSGEVDQYSAKGTSFEKQVKKESNNLKCFI